MAHILSTDTLANCATFTGFLYYVFTWAVEIPLAASAQGWLQAPIPSGLHYLASFGPLLAALIVTAVTEGSQGFRQLLAGLLKWRMGLGWLLYEDRTHLQTCSFFLNHLSDHLDWRLYCCLF